MQTQTEIKQDNAERNGRLLLSEIVEHVKTLKIAQESGDDEAEESALEAMREMALSVSVRDGWRSPGNEGSGAEEYRVLLSTGGPACQIAGDISGHGEPDGAELQVQDWFTPWKTLEVTDEEGEALGYFVNAFCFEG